VDAAYAKVDYFSLHDITSAAGEPLAVKMNIIEVNSSTPLQFVLERQGEGIVLKYERINQFMLTLIHTEALRGQGTIHAYEYQKNRWMRVKSVKLPILNQTDKSTAISQKDINSLPTKTKTKTKTKIQTNTKSIVTHNKRASLNRNGNIPKQASTKECFIQHDEKETLWSIASRHQFIWKTSVYGAMIAIYSANANKFSDKHILKLMKASPLKCPSNGLLQSIGSKEKMKLQFQQLTQVR